MGKGEKRVQTWEWESARKMGKKARHREAFGKRNGQFS
jgi:hypothetical protein